MTRSREHALAQLNLPLLAEMAPVELPRDRERELSLALATLLLRAAGSDIHIESEDTGHGESKADI